MTVEIRRREPTSKGTADRFVGDVWVDSLVGGPDTHVRVSVVRFAPGARNAWHAHALGQTLHVTEGVGLTQSRGSDVVEIRAGDTVWAGPGEWHWHGATADHFMTHLAMWEAPLDGPESEWGDHVSDPDYEARR
jgi:quercetin dioxygenase-like cupin family protein